MNRTRTLLIIGVFMLSLAVLAALEFRVQDEPPSEGQMVTGSLSKDMPALPKLPSLGDSEGNKGGVLVPLDNGTLRGSAAPLDMSAIPPDEETAPAGKDTPETAAPAADPAVSAEKPAPAPMGEIAPADTFTEKRKQPVAEEKAPQQEKKAEKAVAEKPAEKPQPKVSEPKQEKEQAKEGVVVLTTKAPAKLAAGQTAITATRLELGKSVVFRMTGAAPIKTKTLLLKDPNRYVVDLQGNWGIQLPRVPKDLWISGIRLGHHEESTRLVFELTRVPGVGQGRQNQQHDRGSPHPVICRIPEYLESPPPDLRGLFRCPNADEAAFWR